MSENENDTANENETTKQVDPNAYEQVRNDMFKYKRVAQESSQRLQELQAQIEAKNNEQLQEQGKHKEVAEHYKSKLDEVMADRDSILKAVVTDKKINAVRQEALKRNIREEALGDLDMLDMSDVVVETTDQGRYNILGADTFIENLSKNRSHWFKSSNPPKVNNSVGDFDNNTEKTYSPKEVLEIQKKNPELYKKIMKNQNLIRRF
jgi:hypothetical protein